MADASGAVDLSGTARTPAEEEALAALRGGEEPPKEDGPEKVLTAFLVVVHPDGNPEVRAVTDPRIEMTIPLLTPDLVLAFSAVIVKDLTAQEAAQATAGVMQQQAMAMQAQMRDQALQRQISQDPRGAGVMR